MKAKDDSRKRDTKAMSSHAIVVDSFDELGRFRDVMMVQETRTRNCGSHESTDPGSPTHSLNEDHLETVMQDSVLEYVMIATPDVPNEECAHPAVAPVEEDLTIVEDDFVLLSAEESSLNGTSMSTSWWSTLQQYTSTTVQQGGEWTNKLLDATLSNIQPRKSGIHASYDWVSDTKVEGGRLILPGQLISWDDNLDVPLEGQGIPTGRDTMKKDPTSSVIMVSAYDLLACQTSEGRDWLLTSGHTVSFPMALARITKQRSLDFARHVSGRVKQSSTRMKQQVIHFLSPPLASAAGIIHCSLDWLFPVNIEMELGPGRIDSFAPTGRKTQNIELSTVMDMQHRLTVKEHTIR